MVGVRPSKLSKDIKALVRDDYKTNYYTLNQSTSKITFLTYLSFLVFKIYET